RRPRAVYSPDWRGAGGDSVPLSPAAGSGGGAGRPRPAAPPRGDAVGGRSERRRGLASSGSSGPARFSARQREAAAERGQVAADVVEVGGAGGELLVRLQVRQRLLVPAELEREQAAVAP